MPKPIAALMQKEMTRKEFMTTLALGLVSIFGFSSIVHMLTGKSLLGQHQSRGYGSSSYGGGKD